jgi:hypothetical protein
VARSPFRYHAYGYPRSDSFADPIGNRRFHLFAMSISRMFGGFIFGVATTWAAASADYTAYVPGPKLSGELHAIGSPTMDTITLGWIEIFREAHREIEDVTTMEPGRTRRSSPDWSAVKANWGPHRDRYF